MEPQIHILVREPVVSRGVIREGVKALNASTSMRDDVIFEASSIMPNGRL
jgi:hypothetical protein